MGLSKSVSRHIRVDGERQCWFRQVISHLKADAYCVISVFSWALTVSVRLAFLGNMKIFSMRSDYVTLRCCPSGMSGNLRRELQQSSAPVAVSCSVRRERSYQV